MRILANAGSAQAQLDELVAKADKLDGDAIRMRFRIDDAEGKAQLDAIKARAAELGLKDISLKVRVDGAGRAIADLQAVKAEEDRLKGGLLSRLFGGIGSGYMNGPPGTPLPFGGASLLGPAGLLIVPAIGAALVEVTGLVSGFAAAGAGAVAFGALAYPAVKKVEAAYTSLSAAQQAYSTAQAKEQLDPTKGNAAAVKTAADNLKVVNQQISALPASEQAAIKGITGLVNEFGKMSAAFAPQAFQVFAAGLRVINNLLPTLTPLATAFAGALTGLLNKLATFTASKGFADWMKQFATLVGPAVTAIGEGIGKIAIAFGKLLTTMNAKDVARSIGVAFTTIAGIISVVANVVHRLMSNWDQLSSAAATVAGDVVKAFHSMSTGIETSWHGTLQFFKSIPGQIEGFFASAGSWLVNAGRQIIGGLIDGIKSMAGDLMGVLHWIGSLIPIHKGPLEADRVMLVPHGRAIMAGLITGMQNMLPQIEAMAKKAAAAIVTRVKAEVAYARGVAAATVQGLGLTSIDLTQGTVQGGMANYLDSIRAFTADLKALMHGGLNKSLIQQLITAGPVTGDQYAQAIMSGPGGIAAANALYRQIGQAAAREAAQAAMSQYGGKVTPAGSTFNVTINVSGGVTAGLSAGDKQKLALDIIQLLRQYKRHGGGSALGIA
jgi:hypothetical protein